MAAFGDVQNPVTKDITENKKVNKNRDVAYKRLSQRINFPLSQKYLPI